MARLVNIDDVAAHFDDGSLVGLGLGVSARFLPAMPEHGAPDRWHLWVGKTSSARGYVIPHGAPREAVGELLRELAGGNAK